MKNWNKIFEHHDGEWPQETLSMTVDQLLDKLKEMNLHNEYDAIENILKEHKWENKKYDCIIDTQGAELEVLKGFSMNSLNNIENLTVEASSIEVYKGGVQFNELNNFLTNNGFKSISKPPTGKSFQAHIDVKYIKN